MLGEFSDLHREGCVGAEGELEASLCPKVKIWPAQKNTNIFMGHVEKPEGLFDSIATHVAVLSGLFWAVREVKRTKILEKHVTAYGKALVEDRP
jgi:hypothetical protein